MEYQKTYLLDFQETLKKTLSNCQEEDEHNNGWIVMNKLNLIIF